MFSCARICVEVDLEKGLPEAININMEGWSHLQAIDYDQIPFKCKMCHEYGHFSKFCPKKPQLEEGEIPREEWNEVTRKKGSKAIASQANTSVKRKKVSDNWFHVLVSEYIEKLEVIIEDNENNLQNNKEEAPVLEEIDHTHESTLPTQAYIEVLLVSSQNIVGLVTISKANTRLEDSSESREEDT